MTEASDGEVGRRRPPRRRGRVVTEASDGEGGYGSRRGWEAAAEASGAGEGGDGARQRRVGGSAGNGQAGPRRWRRCRVAAEVGGRGAEMTGRRQQWGRPAARALGVDSKGGRRRLRERAGVWPRGQAVARGGGTATAVVARVDIGPRQAVMAAGRYGAEAGDGGCRRVAGGPHWWEHATFTGPRGSIYGPCGPCGPIEK